MAGDLTEVRLYASELRGVGSRHIRRDQILWSVCYISQLFCRNDARRAHLHGLAGLRRAACLSAWQTPLVGGAVRGANDYVSALDQFLIGGLLMRTTQFDVMRRP